MTEMTELTEMTRICKNAKHDGKRDKVLNRKTDNVLSMTERQIEEGD